MKHIYVLLIKFVTCLIAFGIGLDLFFDATIIDILSFSFFVTLASYLLGELVILPQLGKRAAAISDFLLVYLSVWIFGTILLDSYLQIAWGSIISATIITAAEVFVHLFLQDRVNADQSIETRYSGINPSLAFGTEFAEEEDIHAISKTNTEKKNDP